MEVISSQTNLGVKPIVRTDVSARKSTDFNSSNS